MTNESKCKPCPFCGAMPEMIKRPNHPVIDLICTGCGAKQATPDLLFDLLTVSEAKIENYIGRIINKWNMRASNDK